MTLRLPRLGPGPPDWGRFQAWWEEVARAIETQEGAQDDLLAAIVAAQTTADARMPDVPSTTVEADSTGTVITDELPLDIQFIRYNGVTDVSTSAAWSRSLLSGNAATTIGAATGILNLTGPTNLVDSVVRVTSVHSGVTLTTDHAILKNSATASSGGAGSGGGTAASDTTFNSINSTTHAAISDELTVLAGATGVINLTAALNVLTARVPPGGIYPVFAIFRWWNGAAWVDVGAEVESDPDAEVEDTGEIIARESGAVSISTSKTGLVAASSHKFQLYARNTAGARTMTFSGSCGATGS